jgi:cytochrome c-type biogenesis protein CcmF
MPLFGTIAVWVTLASVAASICLYLFGGAKGAKWGRAAFFLAAAGIFSAAATLGILLVTHRFDVAYVYQHSARAMAPLYWFPSFWSGQEGSFLLWAFWISVLGIVLALTSGKAERRVMPIYACMLLFLATMLASCSPFVMLNTQGQPIPTEGLGLNPNLENYWMVIHPPTLFLGFSTLTVPFAFALSALFWRDWDGWLRRALPWSLFGFAVLGLAMMMGGYWAYEMLGWGGFWEWDPVENGPFVPWIALVAFLHAAQIQRVRGGFQKPTLMLALLPFVGAMYESFLTRSGILANFSVHSFSQLGGVANYLLFGGLLLAVLVSLGAWFWRVRELQKSVSTTDVPQSREFGYTLAIGFLLVVGLIACIGMSAPLLTMGAVKLGWMHHTASVKEDFYNKAMFPLAVLLALGLGLGPWLTWRGEGKVDSNRLGVLYLLSVVGAIVFLFVERFVGTLLTGARLVPELLLFTAAFFALLANGSLLVSRLRRAPDAAVPDAPRPIKRRWTVGGFVSHIGAAVLLIGLAGLVTFVHQDMDRLLVQGLPTPVLNGAYRITYLGQTGNYQTDRNNLLRFAVASRNGREHWIATMPFALRTMEGGDKKLIAHPSISHHMGGDLYLSLRDGPDEFYPRGRTPLSIPLGASQKWGPYTLSLVKFQRDPQAAAYVAAFHQMPARFPVWADMAVTYQGKTVFVQPQSISLRDDPQQPTSPEITLPGGALLSFVSMSAGSDNASSGGGAESGSFVLRQPGPELVGFEIDATTRPLIGFIWLGTLLIFTGGLLSMRRRILENRAIPVTELPEPIIAKGDTARPRAKRRAPSGKTAPSLAATHSEQL